RVLPCGVQVAGPRVHGHVEEQAAVPDAAMVVGRDGSPGQEVVGPEGWTRGQPRYALVERALEGEVERSGARAVPDAEDLVEEGDEGSVRQHDQLVPDGLRDRARIVEHARRLPARAGVRG